MSIIHTIQIGDKVKGFEFPDATYNRNRLRFNPEMAEYCGKAGEVIRVEEDTDLCLVRFADTNRNWYYPIELAVNHIVKE